MRLSLITKKEQKEKGQTYTATQKQHNIIQHTHNCNHFALAPRTAQMQTTKSQTPQKNDQHFIYHSINPSLR